MAQIRTNHAPFFVVKDSPRRLTKKEEAIIYDSVKIAEVALNSNACANHIAQSGVTSRSYAQNKLRDFWHAGFGYIGSGYENNGTVFARHLTVSLGNSYEGIGVSGVFLDPKGLNLETLIQQNGATANPGTSKTLGRPLLSLDQMRAVILLHELRHAVSNETHPKGRASQDGFNWDKKILENCFPDIAKKLKAAGRWPEDQK